MYIILISLSTLIFTNSCLVPAVEVPAVGTEAMTDLPTENRFEALQSVTTCSRYDDVRLHCDAPARIVIHEARFSSEMPLLELEQRCNHTDPGTYVKVLNGQHGYNCSEDIRSSINQRCSGQHSCLFSWTRDHVKDPEARARCKGEGIIHVAYRCVAFGTNKLQVTSVCSRRLGAEQSYGYLMSPGYPEFYYVDAKHSQKCNWTIQGRQGQTVTVNVLDVRLRPTLRRSHNHIASEECGDLLRLTSGDHSGSLLADICSDQQRYFLNTFSSANSISVQFISSGFAPQRGFILEYKISGCPTLPEPVQGFLESRNTSAATYRCRQDFYFTDTLSHHKTLLCLNGTRWDRPLGTCLSTYELAYKGKLILGSGRPGYSQEPSNTIEDNDDLPRAITSNTNREAKSSLNLSSLTRTMSEYADVIIPSIIVGLLIVGNMLIVLYIYRLRRQNKQRICARTPIELPLKDRDELKIAPLATI